MTLDAPRRTGHRVLVVDDQPLGRKLAALRLRQAGFDVSTAARAEDALAMSRACPPDAIVCDVRMTGMDGFQLCAAIRREQQLAHLPVLLLSSAVDEDDRQRAQNLGTRCLPRTPDLLEVLQALAAALEKDGPAR